MGLVDKIAKIEHPNETACKALLYAIDHMDEEELLSLTNHNWEHILPLLNNNDSFFESGIWLRLPAKQGISFFPGSGP